MASLRTPQQLQQLWMGSRANFRWGGRQPLRRRRGDVHGDLTAVVLRLDWDGEPPTYMLRVLELNPFRCLNRLSSLRVAAFIVSSEKHQLIGLESGI